MHTSGRFDPPPIVLRSVGRCTASAAASAVLAARSRFPTLRRAGCWLRAVNVPADSASVDDIIRAALWKIRESSLVPMRVGLIMSGNDVEYVLIALTGAVADRWSCHVLATEVCQRGICEPAAPAHLLPVAAPAELSIGSDEVARIVATLPPAHWQEWPTSQVDGMWLLCRRLRITPLSAVLAALRSVLAQCAPDTSVAIDVEVANRWSPEEFYDVDARSTVTRLVSLGPAKFSLEGIQAVQEAIVAAIDENAGSGQIRSAGRTSAEGGLVVYAVFDTINDAGHQGPADLSVREGTYDFDCDADADIAVLVIERAQGISAALVASQAVEDRWGAAKLWEALGSTLGKLQQLGPNGTSGIGEP